MAKNPVNPLLEKQTIKAITTNGLQGQKLLSLLRPEHFGTPPGVEAFARIKSILLKRSVVVDWNVLVTDQALTDLTRNALQSVQEQLVLGDDAINFVYGNLDRYRKHRALLQLHNNLGAELGRHDFDVDSLEGKVHEEVSRLHSISAGVTVTTMGVGSNIAPLIQKIIDGVAVEFIPTGFKTFDGRSVGIPVGSFFLIAATTGGGKSILAKRLGTNMALQGNRVALVPLEMNAAGMMTRVLAEQSGTQMEKFLDPQRRMSEADKQLVWDRGFDLDEAIARQGGQFNFLEFDDTITIQNLLLYARPMGYRIVIIDYLGLLDGANTDDQVKELSRIAAYAKLWAERNNAIVIGAAQLSDDGIIRYSKAMREHASTLWQWVYNEASKETKSILIQQTKSRQQEDFDFYLHMDPSTMLIRDMTDQEMQDLRGAIGGGDSGEAQQQNGQKGAWKGRKSQQPARHFDDLNNIG